LPQPRYWLLFNHINSEGGQDHGKSLTYIINTFIISV